MSRPRRRPALDATKRAQIVAVISVGCSRSRAAQFVGCSPSTIRRTAERDPQFAAELRKAMCNAELALVQNIRSAAKKEQYWRAAAWALERGFPEKYALRSPQVITIDDLGVLLAKFSKLIMGYIPVRSRKQAVKELDRLAKSLGYEILKEEWPDESAKKENPRLASR